MVRLKTPSPKKRMDFPSIEEYVKHLEIRVEWRRMRQGTWTENTMPANIMEPQDSLAPNNNVEENTIHADTLEPEDGVDPLNVVDPTSTLEPIDTLDHDVTMEPSNVDPVIDMEPAEHKDIQFSFISVTQIQGTLVN